MYNIHIFIYRNIKHTLNTFCKNFQPVKMSLSFQKKCYVYLPYEWSCHIDMVIHILLYGYMWILYYVFNMSETNVSMDSAIVILNNILLLFNTCDMP